MDSLGHKTARGYPCEGHFEIYGRKWQRQITGFGVDPEETDFFSRKLFVKS